MDSPVEIPKPDWSSYLDAVSREMESAEVSIELADDRWTPQLETGDLALQFLAYDERDELFEVAGAAEAAHFPDVFRHLVDGPQRIVVDNAIAPRRIEIEGRDGARTIITLGPAGTR